MENLQHDRNLLHGNRIRRLQIRSLNSRPTAFILSFCATVTIEYLSPAGLISFFVVFHVLPAISSLPILNIFSKPRWPH
jgi:hypothetical protein